MFGLFFWLRDVGWATIVGDDKVVLITMMIEEGDVEFVGERVDYCGADAEAGERTRAAHEGNLGKVVERLVVL